MDRDGIAQLLSPAGWALLSALPPYDESRTLALSDARPAQCHQNHR